MNPPPHNQFATYDELLEYVHAFYKAQGYAITTKRSRSDLKGEIKNITLGCDRSGLYRNRSNLTDDTRYKKTASRLIDCPFELFGTRHNNLWYLEIQNLKHIHDASTEMSGHPIIRRLNIEQRKMVKQMAAASTRSH
ncbi:770_t:CDS:1 [Racocetra fulgida]|uniref:770_t:CDS:1 n=1 Tax=Racocetra fulgida TaxID=60492 RepID=A0A9N9I4J0_9GLOM|nr:770_t:CDS:1 [Racocetra fulgida]